MSSEVDARGFPLSVILKDINSSTVTINALAAAGNWVIYSAVAFVGLLF